MSPPSARKTSICSIHLQLFSLLIIVATLLPLGTTLAAPPQSKVHIGLKIEQITGIDQKQENFSVVATIRIDWQHPQLAFTPGPEENGPRTYTLATLKKLLQDKKIRWPAMTLTNQQGRVDYQQQIAQLHPDGTVNYFERFTATFQAPDFDFRHFPFDHQRFYIKLDSVFPKRDFEFVEIPDYSGLGDALGEEEWVVTSVATAISEQNDTGFEPGARFTLSFEAERHLNYYVMRILIPITLIITVSWFTFFLQDYRKRIDLAGANLLLFIAFNFTVSNDLPRLGYLTLIDAVLAGTFIITSLVILVNVVLRRLESDGNTELTRKLDVYAIIGYPVAYIAVAIFLAIWFE